MTLSKNIQCIADEAFLGCSALEELKLPEGLVSIGDRAFEGCEAIQSVNIPSTLEAIGKAAFLNCDKIAKLDVTDINHWCTVELGDADSNPITSGADLYINGVKPEYIVIYGTVSEVSDYTFWSFDSLVDVYYVGTAESFKAIIGLNNPFLYELYVKGEVYYYSSEQPATAGRYWYYNKAGNICRW